jgi:hypothetical protein
VTFGDDIAVHGDPQPDMYIGRVVIVVVGEPLVEFGDERSYHGQQVDTGRKHGRLAIALFPTPPQLTTYSCAFGGLVKNPIEISLNFELVTDLALAELLYVNADHETLEE